MIIGIREIAKQTKNKNIEYGFYLCGRNKYNELYKLKQIKRVQK